MAQATVRADETSVFPRFLDLAYPSIERGKGVWLETVGGDRILDACSGGAMVACLGHGLTEIAARPPHRRNRSPTSTTITSPAGRRSSWPTV